MSLPDWGIATCPLLSVLPECIYQIVEMQKAEVFFSTNEGYILPCRLLPSLGTQPIRKLQGSIRLSGVPQNSLVHPHNGATP